MKFVQKRKKPSNQPDIFSGCLILVGLGAFIFFFTLMDDIDDLKDYWVEITIVTLMAIGVLSSLFVKKGVLSNSGIRIKNNYAYFNKIGIPLKNLILDLYTIDGSFSRYHLRDSNCKITVFSILEDDFLFYFKETFEHQIKVHNEHSAAQDGPYVMVTSDQHVLKYNLDTGKYSIQCDGEPLIECIPEVYTYDPEYKGYN